MVGREALLTLINVFPGQGIGVGLPGLDSKQSILAP